MSAGPGTSAPPDPALRYAPVMPRRYREFDEQEEPTTGEGSESEIEPKRFLTAEELQAVITESLAKSLELKGSAVQQRMVLKETSLRAYEAMLGLESYLAASGLDKKLRELVKIRACQINGCDFCIDLHTKDARGMGESEQRIYALSAWQEAPFFTPEERAALALTEAITLVSETCVPDEVYEEAKRLFGEEEKRGA